MRSDRPRSVVGRALTGCRSQGNSKKAAALGGYYRHRSPPPGLNYWPCKLDGCKKQFQREADLRRHQRTSRTHSKAEQYVWRAEGCFSSRADRSLQYVSPMRGYLHTRECATVVVEKYQPPSQPDACRRHQRSKCVLNPAQVARC